MTASPPPYSARSDSAPGHNGAEPLVDDNLKQMDDERRSLPHGWTRAFDRSSRRHFYVDMSSGRATWSHPYDDQRFVGTLAPEHPANPHSPPAIAAAKKAEEEQAAEEKAASLTGAKKWFAKRTEEFLHGEAAQRQAFARKKSLEAWAADFERRRNMLMSGNTNDPSIRSMYADKPFDFTPPKEPSNWTSGSTLSSYAYGYPNGWGKRYEPDQTGSAMAQGGPNIGVSGAYAAGEGLSPFRTDAKSNYGFSG